MSRPPTDQELMLFSDGELDPARAAQVAAHLSSNPRARAIVAALRQESDLLSSAALDHAAASGADSIADSVMAALEKEPSRPSLAPVRHLRRSRSVVVAAGFFAAAAAVALAMLLPHKTTDKTARAPVGGDTAQNAGFAGSVIDVVDFGARPGTIFYVPSEDESTTAVVWLTEDDSSPSSGEPL
jgi:anti-sigma factor RsiW